MKVILLENTSCDQGLEDFPDRRGRAPGGTAGRGRGAPCHLRPGTEAIERMPSSYAWPAGHGSGGECRAWHGSWWLLWQLLDSSAAEHRWHARPARRRRRPRRGDEELTRPPDVEGPGRRARPEGPRGDPRRRRAAGDLVVVTVPLRAYRKCPSSRWPARSCSTPTTTTRSATGLSRARRRSGHRSELLQQHLTQSHVVKVFNNIFARHLARARPSGAADRSALVIAGTTRRQGRGHRVPRRSATTPSTREHSRTGGVSSREPLRTALFMRGESRTSGSRRE